MSSARTSARHLVLQLPRDVASILFAASTQVGFVAANGGAAVQVSYGGSNTVFLEARFSGRIVALSRARA